MSSEVNHQLDALQSFFLFFFWLWGYFKKLSKDNQTCFLTKIRIIEEDELLPTILGNHLHDDVVEVHRWTNHEGVVIGARNAAGGRAGRTGCPRCGALDEEVGNVHGISQSLKAARRHAADWADQSQDTSIHQLAGWREENEAEK